MSPVSPISLGSRSMRSSLCVIDMEEKMGDSSKLDEMKARLKTVQAAERMSEKSVKRLNEKLAR